MPICTSKTDDDDTVLLFSEKSRAELNKAISNAANLLHTLLCYSDLILNFNRGKMEFIILGTAARRRKTEADNIIKINSMIIKYTVNYKYLGIHQQLSTSNYIPKACRKASTRLGPLRHI